MAKVKHIVMFKLDGDNAVVAKAAADFKAAIEALPGKITGLQSAEVGIEASGNAGNWTLVLTAVLDNMDSVSTYAVHPDHLDCVKIIKPLIAHRACVDYSC